MKTLNEVIKAMENCYSPDAECCDRCQYTREVSGGGSICLKYKLKDDALHYLKEYRKLDSLDAVAFPEDDNPAMTWDELKAMVGKPVWVEALLYKQWAVIAYIGEEYIRFEGANLYAPECRIYMGEDNGWQAYRKERSA